MRWLESLQAKLLAAVCGVALVSIGVFAWVNIRYEQAERVDLVIRGASQFSDTVKRSTHYAMLQNRWEDAFHIMDTIGKQPACATVCPTGATIFGDRDQLIGEARARLEAAPKAYVPKIYGLEEVGGTSVLMLSSVPFLSLGIRPDLPLTPLPTLTWKALSKVPDIVVVGGALLYGIWWITHRRIRVQEALAQEAAKKG